MVQINGELSSLTPSKPPVVEKPPRRKPDPKILICLACGGTAEKKRYVKADDNDGWCTHCTSFFGTSLGPFGRGCTNWSPKDSLQKSADALRQEWVIILRGVNVGSGGAHIALQMGDILKVSRAGTQPNPGSCSMDRTRQMFMIEAVVGGVAIWLYPHEYAPIPFLTIMELKGAGEVEENFVSTEDSTGYFAPSPEMREMIQAVFGPREEARRSKRQKHGISIGENP